MHAYPRQTWRRLWLMPLLALLLLPPGAMSAAAGDPDDREYTLYAGSANGREYRPLDPLTLVDMVDTDPLRFDADYPHLAVSDDGSTAVEIDSSQGRLEDWITVRDGLDGPERLTIHVQQAVFNPRLSADGSRVIVSPTSICGPSGCDQRAWHSYDTLTGELISTTRADLRHYVWPEMITPDGLRLFVPFYDGTYGPTHPATPASEAISDIGPWPLQIAAFDLDSGEEIARVTVPDVTVGNWLGEEVVEDYPVGQGLHPAIAMSPDGSAIAVVDGAMESVTLFDTETLDVIETHAIHERQGLASRFLGWLGVAPRTAEAKISEGRWQTATFAADGRHLYLSGSVIEIGESMEEISGRGLGVLRIDVTSGEITNEGLAGHEASVVIPSSDGQWVYVLRAMRPWWDDAGHQWQTIVHRLDAETLEPLAERELGNWPQLMLVPSGPD